MGWKKAADFLTWRGGGIRHRLLWTGLLFLGVALLANTIAGTLYTRAQIKKAAAQLQTEVASKVANQIADIIERKLERLSDLAVSLSLYEFGSEEQRLLALLLLKNDRPSTTLSILNAQGLETVKVSERRVYLSRELFDQSREDYFRKALREDAYVSPVYTTDKAEPYVTMAVPIRARLGQAIGVVAVELNLAFLWQIVGDVMFSGEGQAYLVDSQGNLIAHQDPSLVLKRTNLSKHFKVRKFLASPEEKDPAPAEEGTGIMGKPVLSTYAPVRGLRWAVVLTEPVDNALADLAMMQRYAILLLGIGLIIGSIIIVWASNRITEPIRELHRGAEIIRQGNLDHRVEIQSGDEIEQLANESNEMAAELKNSRATLERRVEQRTHHLAALYDITNSVNQSLDLDPVLEEVIKKITGIFRFDATRVFLFDEQMEELSMRASFETDPGLFARARSFRRGQGVIGKVAEKGEPVIFEDVMTDPLYQALSSTRAVKDVGYSFFALFPVRTKLKIIGVVICIGKNPRRLSAEEIQLITSMADQIGVAAEKANLFEETLARAQDLSALYDVTATVNQSLEPDMVLRDVVHKVLEVTPFDAVRVYLLDPGGKELRLAMHEGISQEFASQTATDQVGVGISGTVAASGEPAIFEDIQSDPLYGQQAAGSLARREGFRGYVSFPLRSKTKTLGVLNFLSRNVRRVLPKDVALLTSMANQICVALGNASLFEQAVRRAREVSALYDVTVTASQSLDLDTILQAVIEKITDIFHFDTTRIFLLGQEGNELHLRAHYPTDRADVDRVRVFRVGESIVGKAAETGEPMIFEDLVNDPRYRALSTTKNTQTTGFRFLAVFPIKTKRGSVGTILCNGRAVRRLTPGEIQLIGSMAGQIGVAVENAKLFNETRMKSSELANANRELQAANRAKADFLASMSHELRTPLNVIIGNADLCRDGLFGELTDRQRDSLDKILRYSRVLLKLISDVLTLTKIEATKMSLDPSTFEVSEVIAHVQNYAEHLDQNNRLRFVWDVQPDLRSVTTDALKLEEILQNLIGNAYKFTPAGAIDIRVRDLNGNGALEFAVADTGIGIKQDDLEKIFDEFHQLDEAHTGPYSGVGLGLSIVKKYLELMGGDIRVESQPGAGSTFTFTLPYESESVSSNKAQAAAL
jgi:signal transduction histidine kinase/putative methionine-R-sulfoxide reductase with GAF domain